MKHACSRCGWRRSTSGRTSTLCAACRSLRYVDPNSERILWHTDGLIKRGTVMPTEKDTDD